MAKDNISIASLFGISPEEYQYQRAQNDLDTITTAAPNNGVNQLLMLGGRQLGRGLGDLMGAQDPTLARLTKIQAVGKMVQDSGVDPSNPDEVYPAMIKGFQQAGLMNEAMMASQQFQALQAQRQKATTDRLKVEADLVTAQATADKNRGEAVREAKLREELAKLPADATDDQILSVYKRFAGADKGLTALTSSMDKKAQREMQIEKAREEISGRIRQAEIAAESRIDAARIQGATQQQIAQMRIDAASQLELLRQQGREQLEVIKSGFRKELEEVKAGAKQSVKDQEEDRNRNDIITSVKEAEQLLKDGIYTGQFADLQQLAAKASGGKVFDREKAARTERFIAAIGNTVLPRMAQLGGNDSEKELLFVNVIQGGNIKMEPEALKEVLKNVRESAERNLSTNRKKESKPSNKAATPAGTTEEWDWDPKTNQPVRIR